MSKVSFFDMRLFKIFLQYSSIATTSLSTVLLFTPIPEGWGIIAFFIFCALLFAMYIYIWCKSNNLNHINIKIEGTNVTIKEGDIFKEDGFKVISFNEYFDTIVDDEIINERSLNGVFIQSHLDISPEELDTKIDKYHFEVGELIGENNERAKGKTKCYQLGTIFVHKDYLLTAMSKFDESNRATLTMPEYLGFLIRFWDRVNKVYAQKSVTTPIFGSGITRIKGHKNISDEDLLKIMLWTFRISEMRFTHPAKLTIIIHKDKIAQINLLDIALIKNGV